MVSEITDVTKRFETSVDLPEIEIFVELVFANVVAVIDWMVIVCSANDVFCFNWNEI